MEDFSFIDELLSDPGDDMQQSEIEVLAIEEDIEKYFVLRRFLLFLNLLIELCVKKTDANLPLAAMAPISNASCTVEVLYAEVST